MTQLLPCQTTAVSPHAHSVHTFFTTTHHFAVLFKATYVYLLLWAQGENQRFGVIQSEPLDGWCDDGVFQSLRGKKLTKVVRALKKEYKRDPGMDWKHYLSVHFDKFTRVIISDRFRYVLGFG